jgi:hypothetical protein
MKSASIFSEISEGASFAQHQVVGAARENPGIKTLYKAHLPQLCALNFYKNTIF